MTQRLSVKLNCPLPKLDFDVITMGHGSGGLLTHRLLESGVFDLLKNEYLDQQHDGAIFSLAGKVAFSTDSYVISPVFFPGGNIGELAVNGSVNDLAMCGAIPKFLSLAFIIEEGLRMDELWEILLSIKVASEKAGVQIVTGDTKVVERGKGDKIFINTSGIGVLHPLANIHHSRIKSGDHIILSGPMATHGIAIMSQRKGLEFETTIESDTRNLNHIVKKILDKAGDQVRFFRDPTRGGVATVMNELAGQTKMGIDLIQKNIPVDEQVEGACEMLGLDPLYVANEGLFIAIVDPAVSSQVISLIQQEEYGKEAAMIGTVTTDHPGQVVLSSKVGGKRVVNYLTGEQLPRIC
ncbi:MAG: hydrogenase expression/formation protein HypE [Cyclobacteriaceae bacterium]|jgi:hydrogenase expression/formation protein HypE|nr:hydrogenase expression/formation protein HypE [Cytophagales bacterium]HNP76106.1 hydrogenase expression/formation protein HypE [Cyclobacteriaceae bacterium]HQQ82263.1 hydrogenase expression/formation protein HypE [Cyclobacteriaceae bacterium]